MHPSIRRTATAAMSLLAAVSCRPAVSAAPASANTSPAIHQANLTGDFRGELGVQLWSFREQAKADPKAMLRMTRGMGLTHVETAGLYGMSARQFADAIRDANLRVTSMHVSYEDLKNNPDTVIANAHALGAKYVGLAWYPHDDKVGFTEADARRAVADFNAFGRRMKDAGLTFFYHDHGYEPVPYGNGTLLDLMIQETDPALVAFEMDVLWTWLPNVDPVALIQKYPGRFRLMHIKDMKPGVPRGSLAGGIPAEQQAPTGEGQVNWGALMAAAQKDGLQYYYIEDETPDPVRNVPKSIAYLETLKYPSTVP
jgi:sugar phosphate isomerase/epimerase